MDRSNRQAQFEDDYHWYSKDMETPDDNHSNAHHSQVSSASDLLFLLNSEVHCTEVRFASFPNPISVNLRIA